MRIFGRYEVQDKLGEGAMGVVYRARDTMLGRVVALKMLSAEWGAEDELQERFQREAAAVGGLSHPNIVTVYDMGRADGQLYLAMELLEGDDLRSIIERRLEVPVADRVRLLLQMCDGLGYAHSRGVVHRDIKPANMLVTTAGRVKLLDFGLARVAHHVTITRQGMLLGTPDYMSPEQAMGRNVDPRSDIFSAGSVFYEVLCYDKPFKGKTLHSVLYQITSEDPEPLVTLNPEMPARLAAVIARMMRKDPAKRYQAMEEVGQDLGAIYDALRRSRSLSARPLPHPPLGEEGRARVRDRIAQARGHLDGGRFARAMQESTDALVIDPSSDEAAEILWRAGRALQTAPRAQPLDAASEQRVVGLLARAAPGRPTDEVRQALAELALIAPDDPRVAEVVRTRTAKP